MPPAVDPGCPLCREAHGQRLARLLRMVNRARGLTIAAAAVTLYVFAWGWMLRALRFFDEATLEQRQGEDVRMILGFVGLILVPWSAIGVLGMVRRRLPVWLAPPPPPPERSGVYRDAVADERCLQHGGPAR